MIGRLLFMTFGAYLLAAFPACAQNTANYHDSCGVLLRVRRLRSRLP